ncbi:MAG: hypothetical protein ACI87O_001055 [Planctomycetota bacterium]|jgi:hypothetical protein
MITRRKKHNSKSGTAVIASLVLVTIVAGLGAGLVQVSSVSTRKQITSIDTTRALYIAEAGLSEAYLAVAQGRSGTLGSPEEPAEFGDGYYFVETKELADDQVELKATGLVGHGRFTLAMVLRRSVNEVGALGMCGLNDVSIGEGAQLDTWEVEVDGGLKGAALNGLSKPTQIRSNGDITVYAPEKGLITTKIDGHIHPGPNGIADLDPGVIVTGTTASSSRGITLPNFKIPRLGTNLGNMSFPEGTDTIVLSSDAVYENIFIPAGKQVILMGPMRVRTANLAVYGGGNLHIDTSNGPVGIYTTGATIFEPRSLLSNVGQDPTQCSLFALTPERTEKSTVSLLGSGVFFGMIVAPKSLVDIPGDLRVAGSVLAETLNIGANAHVSFTPQLERAGFGIEMSPTIVAWQIVETPNSTLTNGPGTVDLRIRLNSILTKPSATSQAEDELLMKYRSINNLETFYEGHEAGIPWPDVKEVYAVQWKDGGVYLVESYPKVIIEPVDIKVGTVDLISSGL